ncbi:MAG TPA: cytochrome P450, partial [Micromonosporaceae bacterium]|nr:cytochrome P450 [Micromonosporaceae bacterium]
ATTLLEAIDPAALREHAADASRAALTTGTSPEAIAGRIPVMVLATALGLNTAVVDDVAVAARGYQPGTDAGPAGDAAVAALVAACGGTPDEDTAACIALLVQARDATAELINNALSASPQAPNGTTADALVTETLRFDPPVRALRRLCVASTAIGATVVADGTPVIVDVPAANRDPAVFAEPDVFDPGRRDVERHLTFGTGIRPCPGRDHAVALAAGVITALLGTAPATVMAESGTVLAESAANTTAPVEDVEAAS